MRIQHNIMAMSAYRNYNNNTSAVAKNLEKLSSGYKINRAGDDAAGLAISEKMRAQITGLKAAQKNVKDGISLVKTAEGAMQEIQDMLNRMDYLATQSANGTYDNEVDRAALQKEVEQLKSEINRIADSANFNGIKLLDGSLDTDADMTVTKDFSVGGDLPGVGKVLGKDTVLHNKALTNKGTEFSVDLHNFKFKADKGSTMTMTVGETKIELIAGDGATGQELSASDLVSALTGNAAQYGLTLKVNGTDAATLDGMTINGQTFEVSADAGVDYRLNFVQKNPPQTAADEVNGSMKVTINGATVGTNAKYTADFTGLKDTDGTTDLAAGTTLKEGSILSIGGTSYTVAAGGETLDAVLDKIAQMGIDGYTVKNNGDGTMEMTANAPGKTTEPVVSLTLVQEKTGIAGTITANGMDGLAATSGAGATTTAKLTAKGEKFTFNGIEVTVDAAFDPGNTGVAAKDILDADGNKTGYQYTVATSGEITITATKVAGAAANGEVTVKIGNAEEKFTFSGGVDGIKQQVEYDITGWNPDLGDIEIGGVAVKDGAEIGNSGWIAKIDGNKLILEGKNPGAIGGEGPGAAAGTADFSVYHTAQKAAMTEDQAGSVAGDLTNITQGSNGDWNVSTTNINNVTAGGNDRLASTYFDLTEDMVTEGSQIRIGDTTYTFTTDKSKLGQAGYVDITSGDLDKIAKNLTDAAAGNTLYSVGHDGNRITLTETTAHANDLDGKTGTYPPDKWDLSTAEGIAASLGFTAGETKSGSALTLQIGDTSDSYNQLKVSVGDMHTKAMGIADLDISNQDGAAAAIKTIRDAINYVSGVRGDLGATQNRLEHTANNLSVMAENIQDAESTIRDTDVAEEMMAYTKNNILVQSAQAMLAQANQVPQGVLQLLG